MFWDASKNVTKNQKFNRFKLLIKTILFIGLNIAMISSMIIPFLFSSNIKNALESKTEMTKNVTSKMDSGTINYKDFYNLDNYRNEFSNLKPILKLILESVVYIYGVEGFINLGMNLFYGGKLLQDLNQVATLNLGSFEGKDKLGVYLLAGVIVATFTINLIPILLYNQEQIRFVFALCFRLNMVENDEQFEETKIKTIKLATITLIHAFDYAIHSIVPVLFLYTMILFRRHVQHISQSASQVSLDTNHLGQLKDQLVSLNGHFKQMISHFSIPLTVTMTANVMLIISSTCFMMLNQYNLHQYYVSILLSFGLFAFCRLIVICVAGSLITSQYQELLRHCYELIPHWDLDRWMCFIEVKQLRGQFKVNIFNVYSVKQHTILVVLGFCLNYIIVLLQTENYSRTPIGNFTHSFVAQNISLINTNK